MNRFSNSRTPVPPAGEECAPPQPYPPPLRRPPLSQVSHSEHNRSTLAAIRIVPKTPPQLLGQAQANESAAASGSGSGSGFLALPKTFRGQPFIDSIPQPILSNVRALNLPNSSGPYISIPHTGLQSPYDPWTTAHSATATAGTASPGSLSPSSSTASRPKPPLPRKRLHIHDDNKTFSLLFDSDDAAGDPDADASSSKSPTLSLSSTKASSFLPSSDATINAQGWTNLKASCMPTRDLTGSTLSIPPSTPTSKDQVPISADPTTSSPWNYQFVGGLRKVAKTPDLKQKASHHLNQESPLPPLPPLPQKFEAPASSSRDLAAKPSFESVETKTSEKTNYKVYRDSSASPQNSLLPPHSSDSNYRSTRGPSPSGSVIYRPQTAESDNENYEVYDHSSPAAPYLDLVIHPKYSQESLIVPPLKPKVRRPSNTLSTYNTRSRESLRSPSLTSLSTIFSHKEALRAIVGSGSLVQLPIPIPKLRTTAPSTSSWVEPSILYPPRSHMNEHPHQWSSQLSTVLSVSDSGTDRGSRSWSDRSVNDGRVSSNFDSRSSGRNSRGRILSVSSGQEPVSPLSRTESRGPLSSGESYRAVSRDSLPEPPPQPYFARAQRHPSSSSIRMVQDLDEDGDGITDMQNMHDLRSRPSRRRLTGFFSSSSSDNGRSNTMRSTASTTRANSLLASSIPAWARLYYGSGERRYLGAPGSSTETSDSRANSFRTFRSGSPNTDNFPTNIYSPRRRPREVNPNRQGRGSLEINPAPPLFGPDGRLLHDPYQGRRYRTFSMSSLWSPHLRHDRRGHRPSVWEPPSVNWSTAGGVFGRRNVQIVMFIVGFIFPFAWMIAAFLPLPPAPIQEMGELDHSASNLDARNTVRNEYTRQFGPTDEARYESAVWWRKLNRWMSFVGVLIVASVIVLVVIGVKQNWGMPRTN